MITMKLGLDIFGPAKSSEIPYSEVKRKAERFWPLWVAGLQLTTVISHGLKAVHFDLLPQAYAAAARFWVYPIFLIIVIGTWRTHRFRREAADPA